MAKKKTYIVLWMGLLLCSCVEKNSPTDNTPAEEEQSMAALYESASQNMQAKSFKAAASKFAKVQERHPYSKWATQAQVMEAYCHYQAHQYADAIDGFTIFSQLHPYHKDTPYAYYMIGLSHYERISIVERDQDDSSEALKAFQTVLDRYPVCDYAKDAKFKIDFIQNHLASREMSIGRFYQKEKSYLAAINRFRTVVTRYQTTEQTPEALMRLAECYAILNMADEFRAMYSILKINHPSSVWFHSLKNIQDSLTLGSKENKPSKGGKTSSKTEASFSQEPTSRKKENRPSKGEKASNKTENHAPTHSISPQKT